MAHPKIPQKSRRKASKMVSTLPAIATFLLLLLSAVSGFKTGLEEGLICNVCVGTHPGQQSINNFVFSTRLIHMFLFPIPGCGLYDFDYRWYWGKICPRCLFYIYYEHIFVWWISNIKAPFLSPVLLPCLTLPFFFFK